MDSPIPDGVLAQIAVALSAGRKIEAIKLYRDATGKGLVEAKKAVEAMETNLRGSVPGSFIHEMRLGFRKGLPERNLAVLLGCIMFFVAVFSLIEGFGLGGVLAGTAQI